MPDPRFFSSAPAIGAAQIESLTGARTLSSADGLRIEGTATLGGAGPRELAFCSDDRFAAALSGSAAGACLLQEKVAEHLPARCVGFVVANPDVAWAKVAGALHPIITHDEQGGAIHPTARLEPGVILAPGVTIGQNAQIGAGTVVGANAVIGPGVTVGRNCSIGASASVHFALVGDRVSIMAGARIGEAGFKVAGGNNAIIDVPQLGRVILQDGVTIGANSCVDRGGWDDTVVGENTKMDNFVHIAHNVTVGRNCRMAAFTGISGSVTIGDGVQFGGKSGVADQITIGDGAAIGASASVFKDIPAGQVWTGYPARPLKQWLREQATLSRLSKSRGRRGNEQG